MATSLTTDESSEDEDIKTMLSSDDDLDDECSPKTIVVVKGLTPSVSISMLELLLESEKKSGGGELLKLDINEDKNEAWVVFESSKVAERVLKKGELHFSGTTLTLERKPQPPKWDGRTLYITGVGPDMTSDSLELIYESKRKSGGGPVEALVMDPDTNGAYVTFEDKQDAENVLKQEIVFIEESEQVLYAQKPDLQATQVNTPLDKKRVKIEGFPADMSPDTLELIYERRKLSGGGPVASVEIQEDDITAVVVFEKEEDAERVISQQTVSWEGSELKASLADQQVPQSKGDQSTSSQQHIPEAWSQNKPSSTANKQCVQVSGIPSKTGRDYLQLYFENKNQSGGGEIEDLIYNTESGTALIVFKHDPDIKSVMQQPSCRSLSITGSPLALELFPVSLFSGCLGNISPRAVQVTGLPCDVSHDAVGLLFENRKLSGGGELEDYVIVPESGQAVLTYQTHQDAKSVHEKYEKDGINLDEYSLVVKLMEAKCSLFMEEDSDEKDLIFLRNIPEDSQGSDIEEFLETIADCKVQQVIFGQEFGKALVRFKVFPGIGALLQLVCQRPLGINMLEIQSVTQSTKIQVFGVGLFSEQRVQLYFEHTRSEGGPVDSIELVKEQDCAIVKFQSQQVAQRVISHPNHVLQSTTLQVTDFYYECLGIIPPNHDTSTQAIIPKDITIADINTVILEYILSKPAVEQHIKTQFDDLHAKLSWTKDSSAVLISCTLQKSMLNFITESKSWSKNVSSTFNIILKGFLQDEINVLQEGWEEFKENSVSIGEKYGEDVVLKADDDTSTMCIVGKRTCVVEATQMLKLEDQYITEKLEKRKTRIQESISNLKASQLKLLLVHDFPETMMETYKDEELTIHVDEQNCKMVVTGLPNNIQDLKLKMYEVVSNVEGDSSNLSPQWEELLTVPNMKAAVNDLMESEGLKVVWEITGADELNIYATSRNDVTQAMSVLKSAISEKSIPLTDDNTSVIGSMEWIQMQEQVVEMCNDMVVITVVQDKKVDITSHFDLIELAYEQVSTFLKDNTQLRRFHQMSRCKVKYITEFMGDQIRKNKEGNPVATPCHSASKPADILQTIKVKHITEFMGDQIGKSREEKAITTPCLSDSKPGFNIAGDAGFNVAGNADEVSNTLDLLKILGSSLIEQDHTVTRPGLHKYFNEERGKQFVESLEKDHQVSIEIDPSSSHTSTHHRHYYKKSVARLPNGKEVYVVCGDLTAYQVDAIVNAANTNMKHGGGIAKAIVDKGGPEIDTQTRQYVQKHGSLLTGQACITDAGRLPCKKVIHTVGPVWKGGLHNEDSDLYQAVTSALNLTSSLQLHSVAIPAVSAGKYGFPLQQACDIITRAIRDFLGNESTSIREVHLVDNSSDVVNALHGGLTNTVGSPNITQFGLHEDTFMGASQMSEEKESSLEAFGTQLVEDDGSVSLPTFEPHAQRPVPDVDHSLPFWLEEEASRPVLTRSRTQPEEVAPSLPFRLEEEEPRPVPTRSRRETQARTHRLSNRRLDEAQGPVLTWNRTQTEEVHQSLPFRLEEEELRATRSRREPQARTQRLSNRRLDEEPRPVRTRGRREPQAMPQRLSNRNLDEDVLPRRYRRPMFQTQSFPGFNVKSDSDDSEEDLFASTAPGVSYWQKGGQRHQVITKDGLTVTLTHGDIAQQQADVIVNMTSRDLNLAGGGAVSKNILKVGGQQVQAQCSMHGPIACGSLVKTIGGNMQCQEIYHGACNNKDHLRQYFSKCLTTVDSDGYSTISFPSLGTGSMGVSADFVAQMMYDEVQKFSRTHTNTALQEVVFVVYDDKTTRSFENHVQGLTSSTVVRSRSSGLSSAFDDDATNYWQHGKNKCEIVSLEGVTVSLVKGSITDYEADVFVNLTSRELDLKHGAVSTSILQKAGPRIQAECKQVAPRGIQYGGFAATRGHNLPCQYVYHGACEKYANPGAEQHMKQYIDKCLETAHNNNVNSIAFPALGTGSLGFPPKEVAKMLLKRIKKFSQTNPQTSIGEVTIVVYKSAVKDVFEKVFVKQFKSSVPKTPKSERKLAGVKDVLNQVKTWWHKVTGVKSITFRIIGSDDSVIEQVIQKLNQACESEVADKVFDSPTDQEFIQKLTPEQVSKIKQFESTHDVSVTVDNGSRICRIRVQGSHKDTGDVVSEIHTVFREVEQKDREQKHREMLGKLAQWKYEDSGAFEPYPKDINAIIEKAHADKKAQVVWDEEACGGGTKKVRIEFDKMMEFDFQTRDNRSVRRTTTDDVAPLPGTWTVVPDGAVYMPVKLDSSKQEYSDVKQSFKQSMQTQGVAFNSVVMIQRVQNPALYKKYQIHKGHMDASNPSGTRNERTLWHGTNSQVITEIMANGFNRMMGKDQRQWYGKGAYFATHAGLSAKNYTAADATGSKYLFRCKVLTGEFTQGSADMIVPPAKNPNMKSVKYDSVVDKVNNPQEWVIFSDFGSYPEYLIQFK